MTRILFAIVVALAGIGYVFHVDALMLVAFLGLIFGVVPVGIVRLLDRVRRGGGGVVEAIGRAFLVPFGALAIALGIGLGGWVAYNLFVERQPEFHRGGMSPIALILFGAGCVRVGIARRSRGMRAKAETHRS